MMIRDKGQHEPTPQAPTRPKCTYCKKRGHTADVCYSAHPERAPKNALHRKTPAPDDDNDSLNILASASPQTLNEENWVLDSGANCHLTCRRDLLDNFESTSQAAATTVGSERSLKICGHGTVTLTLSKKVTLTLTKVMYAPTAGCNLISIGKLEERGVDFSIKNGQGQAQLHYLHRLIATAPKQQGLYILEVSTPLVAAYTNREPPLNLWHRRLGHTHYDQVAETHQCMDGMDLQPAELDWRPTAGEPCKICLRSKALRKFPKLRRSIAQRPLAVIHSDVWSMNEWLGLNPTLRDQTRGTPPKNVHHVLTFTDDYSRLSTVFFLVHKGDAGKYIRNYVRWIEAQSPQGHKVAAIRSDEGSEYLNRSNFEWAAERGITLETTAGYAPHQNGVAERLNRTLMDKARAMIIDAELDHCLWPYAFQHALYLKNRLKIKGA